MALNLRRLILRNFGGWRYFALWVIGICVTVYLLDSYIFSSSSFKMRMSQDSKHKCRLEKVCPAGTLAYYMQSGRGIAEQAENGPIVCFEDQYIFTRANAVAKRGLNVAVISDKTFKLIETKTFDTYVEDGPLVRYLKYSVPDGSIVLMASFDEITMSLKDDGKNMLKKYGSSEVEKLNFRDNFIMVGQKGLQSGSAIEKFLTKGQEPFALPVEMGGCIKIPLGTITPLNFKMPGFINGTNIKVAEELPNCGVKETCTEDSFPVHMYSGFQNKDMPKICVSGKYVVYPGVNEVGRGFNLVLVDPKTKQPIRIGHFDTYMEDSSTLEIFLEMMKEGDILLAVTFDDASRNLNLHGKKIFEELGSALINSLDLRAGFFFIGQNGIKGYSPYEQIEFVAPPNDWAKPIDRRICVPVKIKGNPIKPDPMAGKNQPRRAFCKKYEGYGDFCKSENVDGPLTPALLADKALNGNPIFSVPIVVIPGINHNSMRQSLETILMQPGINREAVQVMYDEKFPEHGELAKVFGFKSEPLSSSMKYINQMEKAFEKANMLFPSSKYWIIIEEELILAADFLSFMAQLLPVLDKDESLIGISAWNDNGYKESSSDPSLVYRVQTFPGMGFLMKKSFYEKEMNTKMSACCTKGTWHGWLKDSLKDKAMLVPDVSRVLRSQYEGSADDADLRQALFNRARATNIDTKIKLKDIEKLENQQYETYLTNLIKDGEGVAGDILKGCQTASNIELADTSKNSYVVFYKQSNEKDYTVLRKLCTCFKLFSLPNEEPRGLYKGTIRFLHKGKHVILVGSASPFAGVVPKDLQPLQDL